MKTVILSMPTYGPVIPEVVNATFAAIMFGANYGIRWAGPASTDRQSWSEARNCPVRRTRNEPDIDGIIWVDSDTKVPVDAFARLVDHDKDLVSALHFQRQPPYWPNAYKWNPKIKSFERLQEYESGVIAPVDGFGFGCCYTSSRLIRMMPADPFGFGENSEDLGFCRAAKEKYGVQPFLDTGVVCDHQIGSSWSNADRYKRWRSVLVQNGEVRKVV